MKHLKQLTAMIAFFWATSSAMASGAMDFRAFVSSIPQSMEFKHHRLDGSDLIQLQFQLDQALNEAPTEYSVPVGSATLTTYYDRFYLKSGSAMTVNGVSHPLTCLWIKGHTLNFDLQTMMIDQFYLVADAADCTGPVLPNGKDRWETFLKIVRWPYFQSRSNDVFLHFYGNQYKLKYE
jgi:hypothetical protein